MELEAWPTLFASHPSQREQEFDIISVIDQVFQSTQDPAVLNNEYIAHLGSWFGCDSLDSLTTKLDEAIKHAPDAGCTSIFAQSQADSLSSVPWKPNAVCQIAKRYPPQAGDGCGSFPIVVSSRIQRQVKDRCETPMSLLRSVELGDVQAEPRQSSDNSRFHANEVVSQQASRGSQERNFKCGECQTRFKRRSHLKSHIDAVHLRCLRFECKYCLKVYSSNSTMRKHCRNVHKTKVYE